MTAAALLTVALVVLASGVAALVRLEAGPTGVDRMMVAQMLGTLGTAFILLLGAAAGEAILRKVALVVALLAAIAGVAFVRRYLPWQPQEGDDDA